MLGKNIDTPNIKSAVEYLSLCVGEREIERERERERESVMKIKKPFPPF